VTQLPSVDDILSGGGARSATFNAPGDEVGGRITRTPKAYHVREYDRANPGRGPLAYFPSGDPIVGIQVDVQTNERTDPDDDGVRRIYVEKKPAVGGARGDPQRRGRGPRSRRTPDDAARRQRTR
jgi:hypothetical protein